MAETDNPYNLPPDCLVCKYRKDLWCSAVKTIKLEKPKSLPHGLHSPKWDLIAAAADSIMLVVGILLSGTVVKVDRRAEK